MRGSQCLPHGFCFDTLEDPTALITSEDDDLVLEIERLDKLWALKSRPVISLANVRGVTADARAVAEPKGLRGAGTHIPGLVVAGTFHLDGECVL